MRGVSTAYPAYSEIATTFASTETTSTTRLARLRQVSAQEMLDLHLKTFQRGGINITAEEGPKAIWTENAMKTMMEGRWDEWIESVILGTTEDEGSFFAYVLGVCFGPICLLLHTLTLFQQLTTPGSTDKYLAALPPNLADRLAPPIRAMYPEPPGFANSLRPYVDAPVSRIIADQVFEMPAFHLARCLSRPNAKTGNPCKVYMYRFRPELDKLWEGKFKFGSMFVFHSHLWSNR
jgi:carboxylesterase type B